MTTASDLADELEGLAKEATPGEWANGLDDLDCVWSREPTNDGNVVCLPPQDMMELSMERWPANASLIVALRNNLPEILSALRRVEPGSDQPRPSVSEDQGSSRDHALTDGVALDWQDISTAPRDGTAFQARIPGHGDDNVICWAADSLEGELGPCGAWAFASDQEPPDCWSDGYCWASNEDGNPSVTPTHWKPLPADGSGHCTESTTDAGQASGTPNNPSNQPKGGE